MQDREHKHNIRVEIKHNLTNTLSKIAMPFCSKTENRSSATFTGILASLFLLVFQNAIYLNKSHSKDESLVA